MTELGNKSPPVLDISSVQSPMRYCGYIKMGVGSIYHQRRGKSLDRMVRSRCVCVMTLVNAWTLQKEQSKEVSDVRIFCLNLSFAFDLQGTGN